MGRSVVAVRKLLWVMGRGTVVVLMLTVGVVVLLVGGIALANNPSDTPSADPGDKYLTVAYSRSMHQYGKQLLPYSHVGRADTLEQAKWRAYNECVRAAIGHASVYKDDCRGIAWVRDGWLAFAVEDLGEEQVDYEPSWGWAIDQRYNKAKGKAVQQCYEADPRNGECKRDIAEHAGRYDSPSTFNGGPWRNP